MTATEQYFSLPVYSSVRTAGWFYVLSLWMKPYRMTIQKKATAQYFHVVLFIMLHKVVLLYVD